MSNELAEVVGLEDVLKMLEEAPKTVVVHGFLKALKAGSAVIEEALEARTPVQLVASGGELVVEGGDLKGAIVTEITLDSNYRGGTADTGFGKLGFVARQVEVGHRATGHKPELKFLGQVPAHPFMRPAAATAADAAIAAVTASIEDTVRSQFPQEVL